MSSSVFFGSEKAIEASLRRFSRPSLAKISVPNTLTRSARHCEPFLVTEWAILSQSITVQPKVGNLPQYEVQPSDGVRNRPRNGAETDTGSRVWNLKKF